MIWKSFFRRLRMGNRREQLEDNLREEMQQHIELLTAELVAKGTSPEEARLIARRRFGNPTLAREQSRDWWGFPSFDNLLQDMRFGLRLLVRSPAVSLLASALTPPSSAWLTPCCCARFPSPIRND